MASYLDTIRIRIRAAIEQGDSLQSLARKAGLHRHTLRGFDKPGWDPKIGTLDKLEPILPDGKA